MSYKVNANTLVNMNYHIKDLQERLSEEYITSPPNNKDELIGNIKREVEQVLYEVGLADLNYKIKYNNLKPTELDFEVIVPTDQIDQ